ncbi:hypothetical protein [Alteromonas lipolytica]|uniref:Uncharacterized protein n=1 Tax=Alteromonas lipolytica TaxID=1856405 RepID=A0A1E8FCX5_9ALTE|nr:hypothetical protein [Alteromonas lipolytica]OFI33782.1 hypothetical protein BFC17_19620 [Alteromonas lipolytica]
MLQKTLYTQDNMQGARRYLLRKFGDGLWLKEKIKYIVCDERSLLKQPAFVFGSLYREILVSGRLSKSEEASWMTAPASAGRMLALDDRFYLPDTSMLLRG